MSIAEKIRSRALDLSGDELEKNGVVKFMRPVAKGKLIDLQARGHKCKMTDDYTIIKLTTLN
jgi:hypothetical protein